LGEDWRRISGNTPADADGSAEPTAVSDPAPVKVEPTRPEAAPSPLNQMRDLSRRLVEPGAEVRQQLAEEASALPDAEQAALRQELIDLAGHMQSTAHRLNTPRDPQESLEVHAPSVATDHQWQQVADEAQIRRQEREQRERERVATVQKRQQEAGAQRRARAEERMRQPGGLWELALDALTDTVARGILADCLIDQDREEEALALRSASESRWLMCLCRMLGLHSGALASPGLVGVIDSAVVNVPGTTTPEQRRALQSLLMTFVRGCPPEPESRFLWLARALERFRAELAEHLASVRQEQQTEQQ
jgi:hypothetical protein